MNELTIMSQCFAQVRRAAKASPMYREKFAGLPVDTMMTREQFETLPFTTKQDLRDAYPFGGGLHCSTADVYREGECLDYFPNRVEDPTLVRPEMWK